MMRLHFTAVDLLKITFAPAPNALLETTMSVHRTLVGPTGRGISRPGLQKWCREMAGGLEDRAGVLFNLIPRKQDGFVPDFLLQPSVHDLVPAVELAAQTPTTRLAADLSPLHPSQRTGRWYREISTGAAAARRTLAEDLIGYFNSSLHSLWPRIRATAVADRALRAETLLRGGIDALLATLGADWYWRPPILHMPTATTCDVRLRGRGLMLIPSYFALRPTVMSRPDDSTVLIYPMYTGGSPTGSADALGPLLGRTRAGVLMALREPATTTAVAERAGISLASVSQHTAVLRNAGLITTTRTGSAVLHALTPLGSALLDGEN
ncbi:winged helix-turn-helix domain-containing protein [Nonomuraea sp. NPDC050691]|uniref:ArsR/SmtB family transcription factor n=1 Tax=Nonomuraea sp. NPDC050691 TaxID=3155661 RepID=UPI0033E4883E